MRQPARRDAVLLLVFLLTASAPLGAQLATLVKDIDPRESPFSYPFPGPLYANGDKLYFFGYEVRTGKEPWITDGTSTGTELLVDTCPGPCDGDSFPLGHLGNILFWVTLNIAGESALWRTDGTRAGTFSVLGPESGVRTGDFAVASDHLLFFVGCSAAEGCELWASDGTRSGTRLVKDLTPGPGDSYLSLITAGGKVFFSLRDPDGDKSVWVTDGTAAGTVLLKDLGTGGFTYAAPVFAAGSRLVFFASTPAEGTEMWASDGTATGTLQITRFQAPEPFFQITASGRRLYFVADDSVHGRQLWRSDGTVAGTQRLTAFTAASPFNAPEKGMVGEIGDLAVFVASDSGTLPKLWASRGSPQSVKALPAPAPASSVFEVNGRIYFIADDGVHGREPWTTDGTAAGTRMLRDTCPGTCGITDDPPFIAASGTLLFRAGDLKHVSQLWQIDGATAGIRQITDFDAQDSGLIFSPIYLAVSGRKVFFLRNKETPDLWVSEDGKTPHPVVAGARGESSAVADLVPYHGLLYFTAQDETRRDVWKSDGSPEGTLPVTSGLPFDLSLSGPAGPRELTMAGQFLFFLADVFDPVESLGRTLWRTDGTAGGTVMLLSGDRPMQDLTDLQGSLYFTLFDYSQPQPVELWRSDGTLAGTSRILTFEKEFNVGKLKAVGDRLYFLTDLYGDSATEQLWQSDGTAAGTSVLAALPDRDDQELRLAKLGTRLFFLNRGSLWSTDGTPGGTGAVIPIAASALDLLELGGSLYVLAETPGGRELWRSDGTAVGTVRLAVIPGPVPLNPELSHLTAAAGKLFFTADDGVHGAELWTSDGTAAGTVLVQDIFAGPVSSHPRGLTAVGDRLFFTAFDSTHGFELRRTDGTSAGTRLAQDIAPEGLSSTPDQLTVVGDHLFFTADDGQFGRELWSFPLTGAGGCQASSAHLCLNGNRYQVDASWRDSQGHTGFGTAVPLSGDTGYFWFFSPSNVEAVVKVLDGQGVNGHVWVFYGALSNVEYALTVTDTQTGLTRRYFNPQGQLASVGDVHGFGPLGAYGANPAVAPPSPPPLVSERVERAASVACQANAQRLCLNGNRFAVEVAWKDFQGHTGKGTAVPLSGDSSGTTGTFWFFNAANVELVVKALDGRPVNNHFWLFYGALSNVEYTLTVTDTQTHKVRTYTNPSGRFASVADTLAF